ncbi:hypothetical protein C0585_07725 [Candidatus Woesearchaeota archaeon]|mgnify:CR=1 FL=1|nr:MAG: hypothetical protein C0585_07725 [Candidatus Woesearchaeota archaeon]
MKITDYIAQKINRFPKDYIFTYTDLLGEVKNKNAISKALSRMVASGKIKRLSKGRFYKSENSPFGELKPGVKQIVKDLLEKDDKTIGYLTGYSIFNKMGLTTQISNKIQIGTNNVRPKRKREKYQILFVKQKNIISKENIQYLQFLDSIRFIKKIPDTTIEKSFNILTQKLKSFSNAEIDKIINLSFKYSPAIRALLGLMLSEINMKNKTNKLKNSLNPLSTYKIPELANKYDNASYWSIV